MLPCRLLAKYSDPKEASGSIIVIDPKTGKSSKLPAPYTGFGDLSVVGEQLVTVGTSPQKPSEVAVLQLGKDPASGKAEDWTSLRRALDLEVRLCAQPHGRSPPEMTGPMSGLASTRLLSLKGYGMVTNCGLAAPSPVVAAPCAVAVRD